MPPPLQRFAGSWLLREKPSPAGEGGTAQAVTGVEGTIYDFRTAQKEARPHIRHAFRRDTFSPGRRLFSETVTPCFCFRTLPQSGLTASQPPLGGGQETVQTVSSYRPSSGPFGATFPQGKASLRRTNTPSVQGKAFSLFRQPLHRFLPLKWSGRRGMPPPLQRFAGRHAGSRYTTPPPSPSVTPPPTRREAALRRKCVPPSVNPALPVFRKGGSYSHAVFLLNRYISFSTCR